MTDRTFVIMMKQGSDFYATLGLSSEATQAEIAHAYRALLRQYHPDTRTGSDPLDGTASDAALQHILAAYKVLGDPVRRADYDQHLKPRLRHAPQTHPRTSATGPPIIAGPVRWHPAPSRAVPKSASSQEEAG